MARGFKGGVGGGGVRITPPPVVFLFRMSAVCSLVFFGRPHMYVRFFVVRALIQVLVLSVPLPPRSDRDVILLSVSALVHLRPGSKCVAAADHIIALSIRKVSSHAA